MVFFCYLVLCMGIFQVNGIILGYDCFGNVGDEVMLLILGFGV